MRYAAGFPGFVVPLCLLALPVALAFESEPQPIALADSAQLFRSAEFSTGYVPSGSPLAVQFAIESVGGADVSMTGEADLSWPRAFRLDLTPDTAGGLLTLAASLDAVTSIQIDLSDWGYYGTFELDRRSLPMAAETAFEPFLLDGATETRVELVDPGRENELIYYSFEIIAGLSLDFTASVRTETRVGFEQADWQVGTESVTQDGQAVSLDPEAVADYLVDSVYTGAWDATLDLVFTPTAEACTTFGCVTLLSFDIPVNLLDDAFEQAFPNDYLTFPLPLLEVDAEVAGLDGVEVGDQANIEVPLHNAGSLALEGTAHIEGDEAFTVYPSTFTASPGGDDGLVVTFAPTETGTREALLVLDSNDPNQAQVVITLSGNAVQPDVGSPIDEDPEQKALTTCGCASQGSPSTGWALLAAAGLLLVRRRR